MKILLNKFKKRLKNKMKCQS